MKMFYSSSTCQNSDNLHDVQSKSNQILNLRWWLDKEDMEVIHTEKTKLGETQMQQYKSN